MARTPYSRQLPFRMDVRDPREKIVIDHYETIFVGRRNDFLRKCFMVGYEALHGKIDADNTLLGHLGNSVDTPNKSDEDKARPVEKPVKLQEKSIKVNEVQGKNDDTEVPKTKKSLNLSGLIGNQA